MLYLVLVSGILYLISVKIVIALPFFCLGFLLSAWPVPLLAGLFGALSFLLELSSVTSVGRDLWSACCVPAPSHSLEQNGQKPLSWSGECLGMLSW